MHEATDPAHTGTGSRSGSVESNTKMVEPEPDPEDGTSRRASTAPGVLSIETGAGACNTVQHHCTGSFPGLISTLPNVIELGWNPNVLPWVGARLGILRGHWLYVSRSGLPLFSKDSTQDFLPLTSKVWLRRVWGRETVFLTSSPLCCSSLITQGFSSLSTKYLHWQRFSFIDAWTYGERPDSRLPHHCCGSKLASPVRGVWLGSLALPCCTLEEVGRHRDSGSGSGLVRAGYSHS